MLKTAFSFLLLTVVLTNICEAQLPPTQAFYNVGDGPVYVPPGTYSFNESTTGSATATMALGTDPSLLASAADTGALVNGENDPGSMGAGINYWVEYVAPGPDTVINVVVGMNGTATGSSCLATSASANVSIAAGQHSFGYADEFGGCGGPVNSISPTTIGMYTNTPYEVTLSVGAIANYGGPYPKVTPTFASASIDPTFSLASGSGVAGGKFIFSAGVSAVPEPGASMLMLSGLGVIGGLLPRRRFLRMTAGCGALAAVSLAANAQTYPSRLVRIVVGFPPGGTADIVARLTSQWLSEHLGRPFVVENRAGASSNIAVQGVVRAPPDGYTLLQIVSTNAINASFYHDLAFNFVRDIAPVAGVGRAPLVMVVNRSFPAHSVPEFIAYAKAHPGEINMGSAGLGTPGHIAGELFKLLTGAKMQHVPYSGSAPLITSLLGEQVQVAFDLLPASIQHIKAGKLHALAVTSAARSAALPEVQTLADFVPGYELNSWYGIGAPRDIPAAIVDALNSEIVSAVGDPKMQARFTDLGVVPMPMTAGAFGRFVESETEKFAKVVRAAGITA